MSLLFSIVSLKKACWSVKSVCVSSSTFKLQSGRSGTILFISSSTKTAEEDNFCDALFEAVSSKFLSVTSFLLCGNIQTPGNTEGMIPSLNSFLHKQVRITFTTLVSTMKLALYTPGLEINGNLLTNG